MYMYICLHTYMYVMHMHIHSSITKWADRQTDRQIHVDRQLNLYSQPNTNMDLSL